MKPLGSHVARRGVVRYDLRRTFLVDESRQLRRPAGGYDLTVEQESERQQRIVQLVGVLDDGPRFRTDQPNGLFAEGTHLTCRGRIHCSPRVDGVCAALLERGIIEEGIRPRRQQLVRKRGRFERVASDKVHVAALDATQNRLQSRQIHHLGEAVADRLANERMVRHFALAFDIFEARRGIREDGDEEVLRLHPLDLRGHFSAAAET